MALFEISDKKTRGNEGGTNFNPDDKGNIIVNGVCVLPTYRGIAPIFNRNWRGWVYVKDRIDSLNKMPRFDTEEYWRWKKHLDAILAEIPALQSLVVSFYKTNVWDANRLGAIVGQLAADWIYDHIVNGGGRGTMWAQLAAKVKPDGGMGPITLTAINSMDQELFLARAEDIAGAYRLDKAHTDPTQIPFLSDWLRRDGQPQSIIDMVRAAARDGRLDDKEVATLKAAMEAAA